MHAHAWTHNYAHMHEYECIHRVQSCLPQSLFTLFFETNSFTEHRTHQFSKIDWQHVSGIFLVFFFIALGVQVCMLYWLSRELQRPACLCLSGAVILDACCWTWLLTWMLSIWNQLLMLARQALYQQSHLLSSQTSSFIWLPFDASSCFKDHMYWYATGILAASSV